MKKYNGSITLTIFIFLIAFAVFCICAIDAGYIVTARYKAQKITETTALYMVSILNSNPEEKRTVSNLQDTKERLEKLYSDFGGYNGFKITDIEIKNDAGHPKIKLTTETYTPALFLKYTGIGIVKIIQTSYAASYEETMQPVSSDTNSYTFKTRDIITDKKGDDIKVNFDNDYFIFAGLEDFNKEIHWAEIGKMTESDKKPYRISSTLSGYDASCITKRDDTFFDLSSDPDKTIGLVKYIKIYKADCNDLTSEVPDENTMPEDPNNSKPVVTILNSVKLIKRSDF